MSQSKERALPKRGQESVWDYPRPPRVEPVELLIRVVFNGVIIAETTRAQRVLETSHPPVYYLPPEDIRTEYLSQTARQTYCEFKSSASYWTITVGGRVSPDAGWSYPSPSHGFEGIRDHIAFYASRVDACFVGDEQATAQEGNFYGGWITSNIIGPFKGAAGTEGW